jgi:hypothetical protein
MSDLEEKIQTILELNLEVGDEYLESLSIHEKMNRQEWEKAKSQLETLIESMQRWQNLEMDRNLMDLMILIFTFKEEEIQDGVDRETKVKAYYKYIDDIAYLMCIQPKFTKDYLLRKCWQEALDDARDVYRSPLNQKIEYDLTWEDVFETDYFPINRLTNHVK